MNTYILLFGLMLCMVSVNGRHYANRRDLEQDSDTDRDQNENFRRAREHGASQRHRRRSYQPMNYGYEYPQPPIPYDPYRREYDRNQELLPQIFRLLDEISAYVKRPPPPPPPPQPIYIPYPVPYPIPQIYNCPNQGRNKKPNVTNRFPEMDDDNQNWGFVVNNKAEEDDEGDGSRPISFVPIIRPTSRPPPNVEHGSSQARADLTTQAPMLGPDASVLDSPGMCEASALSCCSGTPAQRKECFTNMGCAKTYDNGRACSQDKLLAIIEAYSKAYSPVQ